jgi:hypothetical protein
LPAQGATIQDIKASCSVGGTTVNNYGSSGGYQIFVQALTSSPADNAFNYFGAIPAAPTTTAGQRKIYILKSGTIASANIYMYSGTAGTAENFNISIFKNGGNLTFIKNVSVSANERRFYNYSLNLPVIVGDYIEIRAFNPNWTTNPLTSIYGGSIYVQT